jgi:hypothetical protein
MTESDRLSANTPKAKTEALNCTTDQGLNTALRRCYM